MEINACIISYIITQEWSINVLTMTAQKTSSVSHYGI